MYLEILEDVVVLRSRDAEKVVIKSMLVCICVRTCLSVQSPSAQMVGAIL